MKSWLQDYQIEINLTYNERKLLFTERFVKNLENKIYRDMIAI